MWAENGDGKGLQESQLMGPGKEWRLTKLVEAGKGRGGNGGYAKFRIGLVVSW